MNIKISRGERVIYFQFTNPSGHSCLTDTSPVPGLGDGTPRDITDLYLDAMINGWVGVRHDFTFIKGPPGRPSGTVTDKERVNDGIEFIATQRG